MNEKECPRSWKWTDAHFCSLPSHTLYYPDSCGISTTPQTNVYGNCKVIDPDGSNKFLVASRVGKVIALEYQVVMDKLLPSTKVIPFSYIPAGAELVSLDVISKSVHHRRIVVGVTFIRYQEEGEDCEGSYKQYLNLYSLREEYSGFDNIDDCFSQSLDLDFVPYQLTHSIIYVDGKLESVFLLSGSDKRIHMYREVSEKEQSFREFPTEDCFPEFSDLKSCVHWIDIVNHHQYSRRLTAMGHQDGLVTVTHVNVTKNEILSSWSLQHDSPITNIKIFNFENDVSQPTYVQDLVKRREAGDPVCHVLVLSALEPAAVYRNVTQNGLKDPIVLPQSNKFDIPLCICVVDIDFDGSNEILIGTYGQEVLAYKFIPCKTTVTSASTTSDSSQQQDGTNKQGLDPPYTQHNSEKNADVNQSDLSSSGSRTRHKSEVDPSMRHENADRNRRKSGDNKPGSPTNNLAAQKTKSHENLFHKTSVENLSKCTHHYDVMSKGDHFQLLWQKSFACPVMGIDRVDIMGDGMEDLVVVTLKGVHIIQPDLQEIAKVCLERMTLLTQKIQKTDLCKENKEK